LVLHDQIALAVGLIPNFYVGANFPTGLNFYVGANFPTGPNFLKFWP